MRTKRSDLLIERAMEYLGVAVDERAREPLRRNGCYMNAVHAAELAGKALLVFATGDHPREHQIAGTLARHGLIPESIDERALSDLLRRYMEPRYDLDVFFTDEDLDEAIEVASRLVDAARRYPDVPFRPPRQGI